MWTCSANEQVGHVMGVRRQTVAVAFIPLKRSILLKLKCKPLTQCALTTLVSNNPNQQQDLALCVTSASKLTQWSGNDDRSASCGVPPPFRETSLPRSHDPANGPYPDQ